MESQHKKQEKPLWVLKPLRCQPRVNCWINRAGEELLWETWLFQGNELQDDPDKTAKVPQASVTALRGELMLLDGEAFPFPTMTTPHTARHGFPLSICHCFHYYTPCPHKALLKALQTPNSPVPSFSPSHRGANTSQSSRKGQGAAGRTKHSQSIHGHMSQHRSSMN